MSSITATRTGRLAPPAPPAPPSRTQSPKPSRGRPTLPVAGQGASFGRSDRPVLRIVARAGALVEPDPGSGASARRAAGEPPSTTPEAPLRSVDLASFFAPEYDGDDVSVEIVGPRPTAVRLTRRGRLVVLGAGLVAALGLGVAAATATLADGKPEPTRVVTVQPGQTLWSIASGVAGGGDVRAAMSRLEAVNHLDSTSLQVGQRLRVPR